MYNQSKRPTISSKPFNPAHTHPASISSTPSIQTRSAASASSSKEKGKPAVPEEGIQSGGGGGGGAGAGSEEGIEGLGVGKEGGNSKKEGEDKSKWSDPKKVHPAWEGFGKGPGNDDEEKNNKKKRDGKSKL
ncbi:hypothetical protein I302_104294 [Kwoniella bestiolae CBS 10118]|uniref:Uncharacterized protein n=1 Tax=Kwoniella bestiolae CBS 10118 TaxID=1296100 RepID=A0A1B9GAX1_9TREE|nr:hypothetical protein I302_03001 [Kwoniella bestiolae CBS 10118]OCF28150.1 hypothetical protein I302_03001 [Kwoniella bestiolae CBS 10118]